jgi:1,4-dihydroxy-2-naphthoyl-CoA synthase
MTDLVPGAPPLLETRDGATLLLTLNDIERRNAVSMPLRAAPIEAFDRAERDPDLRAIVLTGAGGPFCAGGDISGMSVSDLAVGRERPRLTHRLVKLMVHCAKPIIATVEGYAVGAGLSLARCCDTIVAAENARFAAGSAVSGWSLIGTSINRCRSGWGWGAAAAGVDQAAAGRGAGRGAGSGVGFAKHAVPDCGSSRGARGVFGEAAAGVSGR